MTSRTDGRWAGSSTPPQLLRAAGRASERRPVGLGRPPSIDRRAAPRVRSSIGEVVGDGRDRRRGVASISTDGRLAVDSSSVHHLLHLLLSPTSSTPSIPLPPKAQAPLMTQHSSTLRNLTGERASSSAAEQAALPRVASAAGVRTRARAVLHGREDLWDVGAGVGLQFGRVGGGGLEGLGKRGEEGEVGALGCNGR